jgi:hypothetical protein
MVENAEREPTIAEIAVALRETRQRVGRTPHSAVVEGEQHDDNWGASTAPRGVEGTGVLGDYASANAQNEVGSTDIGDLRDDEIERLLTENGRLNERIVFLLKIIASLRARNTEFEVRREVIVTERGAIFRGLKATIEAELRPFLVVVLRVLERQRADSNGPAEGNFAARPVRDSRP